MLDRQEHKPMTQGNMYKVHEEVSLSLSYLLSISSPQMHDQMNPIHRLHGDKEQLIALYAYESRADEDLGFKKGDIMYLLDASNTDWWYVSDPVHLAKSTYYRYVLHHRTQQQGYVPRNFVAKQLTVESEEWVTFPLLIVIIPFQMVCRSDSSEPRGKISSSEQSPQRNFPHPRKRSWSERLRAYYPVWRSFCPVFSHLRFLIRMSIVCHSVTVRMAVLHLSNTTRSRDSIMMEDTLSQREEPSRLFKSSSPITQVCSYLEHRYGLWEC